MHGSLICQISAFNLHTKNMMFIFPLILEDNYVAIMAKSNAKLTPKTAVAIFCQKKYGKLNHNKPCLWSKLARIMWTKLKTTTGMTKDSLAEGERKDVVITGTVLWSSETNRVRHDFIET